MPLKCPLRKNSSSPIAFNVLPYAGAYAVDSIEHEEDWTDEELKLRNESRKILDTEQAYGPDDDDSDALRTRVDRIERLAREQREARTPA
jgi:aspartate-semialdehyde dehydrogenase